MNQPHYLRVARALALVVAVPGCTGVAPAPDPQVLAHQGDAQVVATADAAPRVDAAIAPQPDAASDVDAGYPFSSGPIVPPELPESFA
jgi:hypothetical protein